MGYSTPTVNLKHNLKHNRHLIIRKTLIKHKKKAMKEYISTRVPEAYRDQAFWLYNMIPAIPQMPEMAPEKQREENKTGELAEVIYSDQQRGVLSTDLAKMINFTVLFLSTLAQFTDVYDALVFRP